MEKVPLHLLPESVKLGHKHPEGGHLILGLAIEFLFFLFKTIQLAFLDRVDLVFNGSNFH